MCKNCDEKLAPVKERMGEMTRMEEVTALAAVQAGLPLDELVRIFQLNREKGIPGALGAKHIPDSLVESEEVLMMASAAMQVAAEKYKRSQNQEAKTSTEENAFQDPSFDEETLIALLGFQLNPQQSEQAFEMALRGYTLEEAFEALKHHHPMNKKVDVNKAENKDGTISNYVSEENFDEMMKMFDASRYRAAAVASTLFEVRKAIDDLMEALDETVQAGGQHKGLAYQIQTELKKHVIAKVPQLFKNHG